MAERSYQKLKEDTALSKSDPDIELLSFDLQQTLPTPLLTTNVVFYKRQLWTYNLGIHDGRTGHGCMHMWHEGMASRGSNEVGSCILKHLQEMNTDATHLITYSDCCGGQNRNIHLVCLWLHVVANPELSITTVDQKFMVPGHSYLPNDRDFGNIETAKRRQQQVYVPNDWFGLVRNARRKNPFSVCEMKTSDFLSLKSLKPCIVNRKQDTQKNSINWLSIRWIRITKDKPFQFRFRYSLNELEVWKTVNLQRKTKGRPVHMGRITIPQSHPGPRSISQKKLDDLKDLLDFIPPIHHSFYQNLHGEDEIDSESDSE